MFNLATLQVSLSFPIRNSLCLRFQVWRQHIYSVDILRLCCYQCFRFFSHKQKMKSFWRNLFHPKIQVNLVKPINQPPINYKLEEGKKLIIGAGRVLTIMAFGYVCTLPYIWVKEMSKENNKFFHNAQSRNLFFVSRILFNVFHYVFFPVLLILNNPAKYFFTMLKCIQ